MNSLSFQALPDLGFHFDMEDKALEVVLLKGGSIGIEVLMPIFLCWMRKRTSQQSPLDFETLLAQGGTRQSIL